MGVHATGAPEAESRRPLIFDIRRFALDDGPGIRTTVFFKGCPLNCLWCHNPEGIRPEAEIFYNTQRCIACGECAGVCPAYAVVEEPALRLDRLRCNGCGRCASVCPAEALTLKGQYYAPEALVEAFLRDESFYRTSGGGVTFSGGEPTARPEYLARVLILLKKKEIHLALQTCGLFDWSVFESQLLPRLDMIYFDLKCIDGRRHAALTGRDNRPILENLGRLRTIAPRKIVCTIPLIPDANTDRDELEALAEFIRGLPYLLRPYHPGRLEKAAGLGQACPSPLSPRPLSQSTFREIEALFSRICGNVR